MLVWHPHLIIEEDLPKDLLGRIIPFASIAVSLPLFSVPAKFDLKFQPFFVLASENRFHSGMGREKKRFLFLCID